MKKPKKGNVQRARKRAAKQSHKKVTKKVTTRWTPTIENGVEHLTFDRAAVAKLVAKAKTEGHEFLFFADDRRAGPGA